MLQELQSLVEIQGYEALPLSLQRAQKLWESNPAIKWPHPLRFCPGDAITVYVVPSIHRSDTKFQKLIISKKRNHKKFFTKIICLNSTLAKRNDAMTSPCLDRKDVQCAIWRMHSIGPAWPVETQDVFF